MQIFQSELHQKFLSRFVQDWFADHVLAAGRRNQLAVQQGLENARALHAANLHNLGCGDGLFIRHHG